MIMILLLWSILCVTLLAFQYLYGERYLMIVKGRTKVGYTVVAFCEVLVIMLGVYLTIMVEYMDALGIGYLILNLYLYHKFSKRCIEKGLV